MIERVIFTPEADDDVEGLRIIYFVRYLPNEFWMLTIYAKAKHENIPAHIIKQLLEAFTDE